MTNALSPTEHAERSLLNQSSSPSLSPNPERSGLLVPESRVLTMLAQCAEKIAEAASVPDAVQAATMAEAIAAMTQKMNLAWQIKEHALRLALDAEIKLGTLTNTLPKTRGRQAVAKRSEIPSKERTLRELGLGTPRCREAEKLAALPKDHVDAAFDRSKTKTLNNVKVVLGIRPAISETRARAAKFEDDIDFLAGEAVALLKRAVEQNRAPHAGTVDELARRLNHLRMNRQRWRSE